MDPFFFFLLCDWQNLGSCAVSRSSKASNASSIKGHKLSYVEDGVSTAASLNTPSHSSSANNSMVHEFLSTKAEADGMILSKASSHSSCATLLSHYKKASGCTAHLLCHLYKKMLPNPCHSQKLMRVLIWWILMSFLTISSLLAARTGRRMHWNKPQRSQRDSILLYISHPNQPNWLLRYQTKANQGSHPWYLDWKKKDKRSQESTKISSLRRISLQYTWTEFQ